MPINDDNEQKDFDQNVLIIIKHCSFPQNISIFPSLQTNFFFANYYNMKIFLDSGSVAKIFFFVCAYFVV